MKTAAQLVDRLIEDGGSGRDEPEDTTTPVGSGANLYLITLDTVDGISAYLAKGNSTDDAWAALGKAHKTDYSDASDIWARANGRAQRVAL